MPGWDPVEPEAFFPPFVASVFGHLEVVKNVSQKLRMRESQQVRLSGCEPEGREFDSGPIYTYRQR